MTSCCTGATPGRRSASPSALAKLTAEVDGQRRIIGDPPTIVPVEDLFADIQADEIYEQVRAVLGKYRRSPRSDRRHLVKEFTLAHVARKVVGVGSVSTRAWVVLMDAADGDEPLVLQAKEAQPSVLAEFAGRSQHKNEGERVVAGQHLMQAQARPFGPVTVAKAYRLLHGIMATAVEDGLMPQPCNTKGAGQETPTSAPWSRLRHSSSYSTACPNDTGRC